MVTSIRALGVDLRVPRHWRVRGPRFAAGLAVLALTAACADVERETADLLPVEVEDRERSFECTTAAGTAAVVRSFDDLDFSGLRLNVGSKDFVEQFVLGQMLIVGFEAGGGTTIDNVSLGGTMVTRDALLAGDIDAYWEYTGIGWMVHLGLEDPSFDRVDLSTSVCANDLDRNGIRWLGLSTFNNTTGFAVRGDGPAAGLDLYGMADYLVANPDAVVCMGTEFRDLSDGLTLFETATNFTIPEAQVAILERSVIYEALASADCTFGEVATTDGRTAAFGLEVLDDPGIFSVFNVSLTMPDRVFQQAPTELQALVETILSPLDNGTMAELNRQVSVDGIAPREVAEEFLRSRGLID